MVSLLPATATLIGIVVLAQMPSLRDLAGIALVATGVGLHRDGRTPKPQRPSAAGGEAHAEARSLSGAR
jgi:inner membrane transporter RhtA